MNALTACADRIIAALRFEERPLSSLHTGIFWALLLGWFLEFYTWFQYADFTKNAVDAGRHLCWPFFQSCGEWYFLSLYPYANTHGLVYGLLFGLLVACAFALARNDLRRALPIAVIFFVWECVVLFLSMRLATPYWYFHLVFAALFLFPASKVAFLRLGTVLLYFFSGLLKLDAGWLQGAYFQSLAEGLYFVPHALISLATNAVIVMETILVWGLFSQSAIVRRSVLGILVVFHMYSVLYVGLAYPAVILPIVLLLFWDAPHERLGFSRRDLVGWGVITLLIISNVLPYLVSGTARKFTLEGNKYGVFMFDANYQCESAAIIVRTDGTEERETSTSDSAKARCDPYAGFFYLKLRCADPSVEGIAWNLDTSVNGSPFLRIVDVENVCVLEYRAFKHNTWIKIPGVDAVEEGPIPSPNRYPLSG